MNAGTTLCVTDGGVEAVEAPRGPTEAVATELNYIEDHLSFLQSSYADGRHQACTSPGPKWIPLSRVLQAVRSSLHDNRMTSG